ncbi:MAG: 1,2-phenylacetyl-CoA epoxidase subunit PaaE [Actinomycetota bacterium]|nr:1,2-phenylacetyl-CoA epoxidase subunit PaaE [Actinomycetota bacterium]
MTTDIQGVDFNTLTIADVESLTDDAVAITFDVPSELADTYRYVPGQHVAVRAEIDGRDVRRTYSICANAATNRLRIGVKRIDGGTFSSFATMQLHAGDQLDVAAPYGEFTVVPDAAEAAHYGAIAAGSGITPILSMIATVLEEEPNSRFTLLFGNRTSASIMFLEELEGLKDRYPSRFHLVHVLSREAQIIPVLSGRLDEERLETLLDSVVDTASVDDWYLCGPYELVHSARAVLGYRGVSEDVIHDELFFAEPTPAPPPAAPVDETGMAQVTFTLDGRTSSVLTDPNGPPILAYALEERRDTPFSCRGGMCTTCKAQVLEGEASMDLNFALAEEDLAKGYILTCQAHPKSEKLTITYDV